MKKITTLLMLLTCIFTAQAQSTVEWTTAENFQPNDQASCFYVGIKTPGTEGSRYTMTAFSFYEMQGYGASTIFTAISKSAPSAETNWTIPEEDVLGVSIENTNPDDIFGENEGGYIDYTLSEGIELQGNTTYYMVFVTDNVPTEGVYTVGTQRVRLIKESVYEPTVCLGNGQVRNDLIPGFKATLTTFNAYTVNYTCLSVIEDEKLLSGSFENVVGTISAPEIEGYAFSHATTNTGEEFSLSQDINQDYDLIFYYAPLYDVTFRVLDENGKELDAVIKPLPYGSVVTQLPEELDQSMFYDYSEINQTVDDFIVVDVVATMKENPLFKFNADASGDLIYNTLVLKGSYYIAFAEGSDPNVAATTENPDNATSQWAFIGNPYKGFQISNRAAGTNLLLGSESPADDGGTGEYTMVMLAGEGGNTYQTWIPRVSSYYAPNGFYLFNEEGYALNLRNEMVAYWVNGYDSGSTFTASEVLEGQIAFDAALNELKAINFGPELGQYAVTGDFQQYAGNEAALIDYINANFGEIGDYDGGVAFIKQVLTSIALNMPTEKMFLRITSTHRTYLSSKESEAVPLRLSLTEEADASTIFYFDGTYLISLPTGVPIAGREVGAPGETGVSYWFEPSSQAGKYAIRFNPDNGANRFLYAWGTDRNYADQNGSDHDNCAFTLENVKELPLTLTEYGGKYYTTFSAPVAIAKITGATICKVIAGEENAKVEEAGVTGVPAEVGVLLVGDTDTAIAEVGECTEAIETDLLPILFSEVEHDGLFLGISEDEKIGFWTTEEATGGFKAYLDASLAPAGTNGLELSNIESGVKTIEMDEKDLQNVPLYNVQGQRVTKAQRGVYIQNGRKVIVK